MKHDYGRAAAAEHLAVREAFDKVVDLMQAYRDLPWFDPVDADRSEDVNWFYLALDTEIRRHLKSMAQSTPGSFVKDCRNLARVMERGFVDVDWGTAATALPEGMGEHIEAP